MTGYSIQRRHVFSIDVMFEGPEIVLRAAAHGREVRALALAARVR